MKIQACSSCGAKIFFVPTEASEGKKLIPLDEHPDVDKANVELVRSESRNQTEARVHTHPGQTGLTTEDPPHLYLSHFVTCPNAKEHHKS